MVIYKDDKIIYVGCEKEFDEDVNLIDGEDAILMPGMINCHTSCINDCI